MKLLKYIAILTIFSLGAFASINAQTPEAGPKVTPLKLPANANSGQIDGDIKDGKTIALGWAERSSVACFPGTRFEMFDGNHVFYRIELPARSKITIALAPEDGKLINLYALRLGAAERTVPPNISSAISCEARYPIYANLPTRRNRLQ